MAIKLHRKNPSDKETEWEQNHFQPSTSLLYYKLFIISSSKLISLAAHTGKLTTYKINKKDFTLFKNIVIFIQ